MVEAMIDDIKAHVPSRDDAQLEDYLRKILRKEAFDGKGLIYGLGHAVYTLSDPRAILLKQKAAQLAEHKGQTEAYLYLTDIERIGVRCLSEKLKSDNAMAANVDLYAGFVLKMLGIPEELYTPLFAISRIAGWSAHRLEQIQDEKIMRPAYVCIRDNMDYVPLKERK